MDYISIEPMRQSGSKVARNKCRKNIKNQNDN